jgi:outer membrane biosynthesis protein TonB
MDLNKAKVLLDKIASLHKSMSTDAENISAIEKDLMLNYVKQLYEAYLFGSATKKVVEVEAPKVEIIKSTPKTQRKPVIKKEPPVLEVPQIDEEEEVEIVTPKPKPRVIELPDSLKNLTEPEPAPKPRPTPPPTPVSKPAPQPIRKASNISPEIEELFEVKQATELSEKLASSPIRDLRKAMGLNEKIFTINELFGGDQASYDATIATLNGVKNFDQAKAYLIENVASKYNWTNKERKKKAANFIKLVSRRYN